MDRETWQKLLPLESHDIAKRWFQKIHSRELGRRRTNEINAAARQAREYFRNADHSDFAVRPLLTFYGVSSLSRALLLLLRVHGGEEALHNGHGIETVGWRETLSGDTAAALVRLVDLKIRKRAGLFAEFVEHTRNRMTFHVNSSGVDWRFNYDVPENGSMISVADLFSRVPDLQRDYEDVGGDLRYARVRKLTVTTAAGVRVAVNKKPFPRCSSVYEALGYASVDDGDSYILTHPIEGLEKVFPQFVHTYLHKAFGTIPDLFIAEPFPGEARYSQLSVTYMVSFVLGMLVRYYPTHWMALVHGDRGDSLWPTVNRAQRLVEQSYPELVAEMIYDMAVSGHAF